jgi:ferredoxin
MKIWVDRAKCTGSGLCLEECPSLFSHDPKGKALIKQPDGTLVTGLENRVDVAPADQKAAQAAYDACPTSAIGISDE